MSKEEVGDDWDFSPVIDLIYSLSPKSESLQPLDNGYGKYSDPCLEAPLNPLPKDEKDVSKDSEAALGNFDSVWQFLRRPVDIPSEKNVPGTKEVRWRDEINGADLADDDEDDGKSLSGLTKTQRKKARRKQRHKEEANGFRNGKIIATSDENESEPEPRKLQTPDRKAVISQILHGERIRVLKRPAEEKSKHQAAAKESARAVAAAKKEKLMTMLKERYIEERPYLSNLSLIQHPDTGASNTNEGIHIFVDASNVSKTSATNSNPTSNNPQPDNDRFPTIPPKVHRQNPQPLPPTHLLPPMAALLLPHPLPNPLPRPPDSQTHPSRLRQLPLHRRSKSHRLRDQHPRPRAQSQRTHHPPEILLGAGLQPRLRLRRKRQRRKSRASWGPLRWQRV